MDRHKSFSRQIVLLYGMLYSLERFCVEHLRTDSLMIGPLKQAQVLSATVFLACLAVYLILYQRHLKTISEEKKENIEGETDV